jgi:hypothetical protein
MADDWPIAEAAWLAPASEELLGDRARVVNLGLDPKLPAAIELYGVAEGIASWLD